MLATASPLTLPVVESSELIFAITPCEAMACGGTADSLESTVGTGHSGWTPPKEFRRDVHIKATSERAAGNLTRSQHPGGVAAQLADARSGSSSHFATPQALVRERLATVTLAEFARGK
jgi:hypothetical protein